MWIFNRIALKRGRGKGSPCLLVQIHLHKAPFHQETSSVRFKRSQHTLQMICRRLNSTSSAVTISTRSKFDPAFLPGAALSRPACPRSCGSDGPGTTKVRPPASPLADYMCGLAGFSICHECLVSLFAALTDVGSCIDYVSVSAALVQGHC